MYFLTIVTHERRPLFAEPTARRLLREAHAFVRKDRPFESRAIVLMPDHLHVIWRLPDGDCDYPTRIAILKKRFTEGFLAAGGKEGKTTPSRAKHRVRGVWEKRYYEHTIRNFWDYQRHFDYIHLNPVKHGYVARPGDWPWSTFAKYVKEGVYEATWLGHVELPGGWSVEPDQW